MNMIMGAKIQIIIETTIILNENLEWHSKKSLDY